MRIAQVTHRYRPSLGGIENYVYRLNDSLRTGDHSVVTLTTDASLANGRPRENGHVEYCKTSFSMFRNPFSFELFRHLRHADVDIVHAHDLYFFPSLEAAAALDGDTPSVVTLHGVDLGADGRLIRTLDTMYRPFAQYILDSVDRVVVLGESERANLNRIYDVSPERVSVIPNGIRPEEYDVPDEAVERFREWSGLDPDLPTVLYVSRLVPEKKSGVFVDAFVNHLPDADVQVLVIGAGEDDYVSKLEARADDRFHFHSNLSFDRLKAAYHASDLFVFLGSVGEGLPTVILEAMNARLPVVATAVGAVPDVISDPENGRLIQSPAEPAGVAGAVREFLDFPGKRVATGKHNRRRVREHYHWDDIAARLEELYEEVVRCT